MCRFYRFLLCSILVSGVAICCPFVPQLLASRYEVSTYYPSPYGQYEELRAKRMAIGNTYSWVSDYVYGTTWDTNASLIVEDNVGIGITLPQAKFHVKLNDQRDVAKFEVQSGDYWVMADNGFLGKDIAPSMPLDIWASTTAGMYTARLASSSSNAAMLLGIPNNAKYPAIQGMDFATNQPLPLILQESGGNVGIGLNNPNPFAKLHLHNDRNQACLLLSGASDNGQTYSAIYLSDAQLGIKDNSWVLSHIADQGGDSADDFWIYRWKDGVGRGDLVVDSVTGDVGIGGNPSPYARLHVHANKDGQGALFISGPSDNGATYSALYLLREQGTMVSGTEDSWVIAYKAYANAKDDGDLWIVRNKDGASFTPVIIDSTGFSMSIGVRPESKNDRATLQVNNPKGQGSILISGAGDSQTYSGLYLVDSSGDERQGSWVLAHKQDAAGDLLLQRWTHGVPKTALSVDSATYNVAIGGATPDPTAKLYIDGNTKINGILFVKSGDGIRGYDIAETYPISGDAEEGDVMIADFAKDGYITKSKEPYAKHIIGIVSANPGILIDGDSSAPGTLPIALKGRVMCKATTENGPINRGDILVSSSKAGYAMKADNDKILLPTQVVGIALQALEEGDGEILVFVE